MTNFSMHPQRYELANELHARPFADLEAPESASHIAMIVDREDFAQVRAHVQALCNRFGETVLPERATHALLDFGNFRLKWELHTEFVTYTFLHRGARERFFGDPAIARVPQDWLAEMPGECIVAVHAMVSRVEATELEPATMARDFSTDSLCSSVVLDGAAQVFSDFRLHEDGFARILIRDQGLSSWQAGWLMQRLLELYTYQTLGMLALPVARSTSQTVSSIDSALADLTARMKATQNVRDEEALLEELIEMSAVIEETIATSSYRFNAARAYSALVEERLRELAEVPAPNVASTLGEFIDRRFAPAMRTCESVVAYQEGLSSRATRAANLIRTSVDIALENQNSALLASMNRRARLQVRLQQTVEGLSVAAITYYLVGLFGYLAGLASSYGLPVDPVVATGVAVPVVAVTVWLSVRIVRRAMTSREEGADAA